MKIKTVISLIVIVIMLFLARSMYSNHNLEKIFNACVLGKAKNFSVEEAKKVHDNTIAARDLLEVNILK